MGVAVFAATGAVAQDATWLNAPGSNAFNSGANWSSGTTPTGTASFGLSNTTALSISSPTTIGGFTFQAGAPAYDFNTTGTLTFNGAGIVTNGGSVPSLSLSGGANLAFNGTASGGNALVTLGTGSTLDLRGMAAPVHLGNLSGAGNVLLTDQVLSIGAANLDSSISGSLSSDPTARSVVTKTGAGTLTLTGNNGFRELSIAAGTLQLGNGGGTGTLRFTDISNEGTLLINRSGYVMLEGVISGGGTVRHTGSGTTILLGDNTFTRPLQIDAGTVQMVCSPEPIPD